MAPKRAGIRSARGARGGRDLGLGLPREPERGGTDPPERIARQQRQARLRGRRHHIRLVRADDDPADQPISAGTLARAELDEVTFAGVRERAEEGIAVTGQDAVAFGPRKPRAGRARNMSRPSPQRLFRNALEYGEVHADPRYDETERR